MESSSKINERGSKKRLKQPCTACGRIIVSLKDAKKHPALKTLQCITCHNAYLLVCDLSTYRGGVELNGQDNYCRWCLDGGDLILCADESCRSRFCSTCIERNFGPKRFQEITDSKSWYCFVCDPIQLEELQVSVDQLMKPPLTRLSIEPKKAPVSQDPPATPTVNMSKNSPKVLTPEQTLKPAIACSPDPQTGTLRVPTPDKPVDPLVASSTKQPSRSPRASPPSEHSVKLSKALSPEIPVKALRVPSPEQPVNSLKAPSPKQPAEPLIVPIPKATEPPEADKRTGTNLLSKEPVKLVNLPQLEQLATPAKSITAKGPSTPVIKTPLFKELPTPVIKTPLFKELPTPSKSILTKDQSKLSKNLPFKDPTKPIKILSFKEPSPSPPPQIKVKLPTTTPKNASLEKTKESPKALKKQPVTNFNLFSSSKLFYNSEKPAPVVAAIEEPPEENPSMDLEDELYISDDSDSYDTPIGSPDRSLVPMDIDTSQLENGKPENGLLSQNADIKTWALKDACSLNKRIKILNDALTSVNLNYNEENFKGDTQNLTSWVGDIEAYLKNVPFIVDRCQDIMRLMDLNK